MNLRIDDITVKQKYINKLGIIGKIMYYSRIARFWKDGDYASFLWNLWNPLSWLFIIFYFVIAILFYGLSGIKKIPGLRLSNYWKEHKDERYFF